jgi:hypothetical protein
MNNFNSSMEILAGLSMGPVSRLKHTWGVRQRQPPLALATKTNDLRRCTGHFDGGT